MIQTYGSGNSGRSMVKSIDWLLVAVYALLVIIGIINIYASIHSAEAGGFLDLGSRSCKQLLWWGISLIAGAVILFVLPARIYELLSIPSYLLLLLLLIAVIFLGQEVNGSHSWFSFGPIKFQPAELSKVTTSLMLAAYMSRGGYSLKNWKDFLITGLILLIPMVLIVTSKETGSALVYVGFVFMLYREGLSGWVIVMGGMAIILFVLTLVVSPYAAMLFLVACAFLLIGLHSGKTKLTLLIEIPSVVFLSFLPMIFRSIEKAVYGVPDLTQDSPEMHLPVQPIHILSVIVAILSLYCIYKAFRRRNRFTYLALAATVVNIALIFSTEFIFNSVLQNHQRKRIEVLLNMTEDQAGVGYNVRQSMIAIGSGGFAGKGYLQGTQTTFGFVPEQSTDFIFCTIGEEWGFLGSAFTVMLFCFLISRILHDAEQCRESFSRIYGYCLACCLFMHLAINVGMTIGVMPVIGIPLPFISYGGSSLLTFSVMLFIFLALYRNEKKYF